MTQQGDGYVTSEESKKGANDEIYMRHGKYTTCDNHDHPHFYLKLSMAKVRPKKDVVFGPAQLVVEDVPFRLRFRSVFSRSAAAILQDLSCRLTEMK